MNDLKLDGATVLLGDCIERLKEIPNCSAQMCVTSPPYFGLRDYGVDGQIGLEKTPDAYIAKMVEVFREVRRVLADDGTLWLNIGDSYANDGKWGGSSSGKHATALHGDTGIGRRKVLTGLKPKDLIGIPWMLAFALRADGWYLRQDIIWHKPNAMPESVRDRCTKAHEYIFLLSKSGRYFYDSDAIKEHAVGGLPGNKTHRGETAYLDGDERMRTKAGLSAYAERKRTARDNFRRQDSKRAQVIPGQSMGTHRPDRDDSAYPLDTRNRRSVWTIATHPYKGAHFATFPPALVEPCILAGTSERGHCPGCGARWDRIVKQRDAESTGANIGGDPTRHDGGTRERAPLGSGGGNMLAVTRIATDEWRATCDCGLDPVPDLVLDPFNGSGTTGQVAIEHGREYVGVELNPEYLDLTRRRLEGALAEREADRAQAAPAPQMDLFGETA